MKNNTESPWTRIKPDGLDAIDFFFENNAPEKGSVTIRCSGEAWTAYWASIGERSIEDFFAGADIYYLAEKLAPSGARRYMVDYEKISQQVSIDASAETLLFYDKEMTAFYGDDWMTGLPQKENPDYYYLRKVIGAIQASLICDKWKRPQKFPGLARSRFLKGTQE